MLRATMQAIVFDNTLRYVSDHPDPQPGDGECLIRVHLAGICATDLHITQGYMAYQGILGHEFVGTVERGSAAWQGKRVVAEINCVCRSCDLCQAGLSHHCRQRTVIGIAGRAGCFADRIAVPERNLHAVPDRLSDEEAVFVEPVAAAHQVLAQAAIEPRHRVTVVGAGRLGLLVAQLLKETGCKLTVVDRQPDKLLFCEKKGIQGIALDDIVPRQDRDVVVDCSGSPAGLALSLELVRPRGVVLLKSTFSDTAAAAHPLNLAPAVVNEVTIIGSRCGSFPDAINALTRQAVDVRSMIARQFPLAGAAEAFAAARDDRHLKILFRVNPRS